MPRVFDQDDDYVELRPERRTLPKVLVVLAVLVAALGFAGISVRTWYRDQVDPSGPPGVAVTVVIPKGTTITGSGSILADRGVISSSNVFRFWVRDKEIKVQAGTYTFHKNSSFDEAVTVLEKGPAPAVLSRVTIPEGLTIAQMIRRLAKLDTRFTVENMEAAIADPTVKSAYRPDGQASLEGLLFPSTYDLGPKDTARTLVDRMSAEMAVIGGRNQIEAGVVKSVDEVPTLTPYEIITVASLIQAESGNAEESPKIARVIYNRLLRGEPLGIDATSRYLSLQTGKPIDFESDSPYNTRRQKGLPPTPIGAPGEAALQAALRPADGNWTYYVLEAKGRHFFTNSADEFNQKKQECEDKGLGCG